LLDFKRASQGKKEILSATKFDFLIKHVRHIKYKKLPSVEKMKKSLQKERKAYAEISNLKLFI